MNTSHTIKQLEEKIVASEINIMVWSDRLDLVAISNIKGEVALHRLTSTKAWLLSPPKEGLTVKGIAWKPDGKLLSIAYSSGQVFLVNVENKTVLDSGHVIEDLSYINWLQEKVDYQRRDNELFRDDRRQEFIKNLDSSEAFLKEPLQNILDDSSDESNHSINKIYELLQNQNELNLLVIGTTNGIIHIYIFGYFSCCCIDLKAILNIKCSIESIHLTEDLCNMFVTLRDESGCVKIALFNTKIFKTHRKELFATALTYVKLMNYLNYLSVMITSVTETWEGILLEMDDKLSNFAKTMPEGGITADFLDLLMFGFCSGEMEEFLVHDLTQKGLEKFGKTIELSYTNIQDLLLKFITKFGQNITYHLATFRGMARLEHRYQILGLCEDTVTQAIQSNGSFLIKVGEMQQIINNSIINYKAFFRWLHLAIMRLMDETIAPEMQKMTQQDVAHIAEFIQNFDHIGSKNQSSKFTMERLGQYLEDAPLKVLPDVSNDVWSNFLAQNQCVQNSAVIFKHYPEMSLIQQYKHLKKNIEDLFIIPEQSISSEVNFFHSLNFVENTNDLIHKSQINSTKNSFLFVFLQSNKNLYLIEIIKEDIYLKRCLKIKFKTSENIPQNIIDVKFYSNATLTLLLEQESKSTTLCQFCFFGILDNAPEIELGNEFTDEDFMEFDATNSGVKILKNIEGLVASQFAVSGIRKVSVVLSENKRKIRFFEMEGEEEDEDDADMTGSMMKESDIDMQDESVL